ncbi:hypothetical protein [Pseudodesulfovibrio indicus]|uniref:hypothetical protein n=1 Tax=Pseudodesulfovibrio indicus TaxID=1716143 RepID=UPI00292F83C1|nr:hypothetical protein [Pseudodesulfovibrio indicus]
MERSTLEIIFFFYLHIVAGVLLWLGYGAWKGWQKTKKELAALSGPYRTAIRVGSGLIIFAGSIKIPWIFKRVLFADFLSDMFLSVGATVVGVGLFELYKVQFKIQQRKLGDKIQYLTLAERHDKYGF